LTIRDKILEELRKGTPLAQVRKEHESVSKTYEALREFLDESEKIADERQKRIEDLKNVQAEEEKRLSQTKQENMRIAQENEELAQLNEKLIEEKTQKTEELHRLNEDIAELSKRGYSPKIIREIGTIEARSGRKLLKQIRTAEKFSQTKKEFSSTKRRKRIFETKVQELLTEIAELKRAVLFKKNMLDELNIRTATYEEAVVAVEDLLKNGYSVDDIRSLVSGLTHFGIKEDPKTSINRLVSALKKLKDLYTLDKEVGKAEKKLALVKKETAETRQESKVVKETTIKTIEDEKDAAVKSIDNIGARANARLEEAAAKFEDTVERGEDYIQRIAEACREGLGEYSKLQQEMGKLEKHIFYGRAFFGVLNSTDYLMTIPPTVVAEILDRVALWSRSNYPEFTVSPSPSVIQKENKLLSLWKYNLAALIQCVSEGLRYQIPEPASGEPGA